MGWANLVLAGRTILNPLTNPDQSMKVTNGHCLKEIGLTDGLWNKIALLYKTLILTLDNRMKLLWNCFHVDPSCADMRKRLKPTPTESELHIRVQWRIQLGGGCPPPLAHFAPPEHLSLLPFIESNSLTKSKYFA